MWSFAIHVLSLGILTANLSFASPVPHSENKPSNGAVATDGYSLQNDMVASISEIEPNMMYQSSPYHHGQGFRWEVKKWQCRPDGPLHLVKKNEAGAERNRGKWDRYRNDHIGYKVQQKWQCPPGSPVRRGQEDGIENKDLAKKDEGVADVGVQSETKNNCFFVRESWGTGFRWFGRCPPGGSSKLARKDDTEVEEFVTDEDLEPEMKANCHKQGHPFLVRRFSCETDQDIVKKDGSVTSTTFDVPVGKDVLSLSSFEALIGRRQLVDSTLQELTTKSCAKGIAERYEPANFNELSLDEIEALMQDAMMCWFSESSTFEDITRHQVTKADIASTKAVALCPWDLVNKAYQRAGSDELAELDKDIWWMVHTYCLKNSATPVQQPVKV